MRPKRRYHLSLVLLVYAVLTVVLAMAAMNTQKSLLFWMFGVMLGALMVSGIVSEWILRGLHVRRLDPRHGTVGEPLTIRYEVENRNRLMPAFNVHVGDVTDEKPGGWWTLMKPALAWVMHIGPREKVHGEALLWPARRGRARFDHLRLYTSFPFGLIGKSTTISQEQHTLIFPMLYELKPHLLQTIAPAGPVGSRISTRPGAGDDYYGLREYKSGDSLRNISWKRSAMLDELVSIERSHPEPPRIRIVVDLTEPTGSLADQLEESKDSVRELEERAISLAASVVRAADLEGYEVGLTVLGVDAPSIAVRRSHWHVDKIMAALAEIDLEAARLGRRSRAVPDAERTGVVVVHPTRPQPLAERPDALALSALQLESLVLGPLGTPPEDSLVDDAGKADSLESDRQEVAA